MGKTTNKPTIPVGIKMDGTFIQDSSFIHISVDKTSGRENPFLRKVRQTNLLSWASTYHFMAAALSDWHGRTY